MRKEEERLLNPFLIVGALVVVVVGLAARWRNGPPR